MKSINNSTLYKSIKKLMPFIGRRRRIQIIFLQVLSFFSSMIEAISVGALIPFLAILSNPDTILTNPKLKYFLTLLNIIDKGNLIKFITLAFAILVIISGILKWVLLYCNSRISNSIASHLAYQLYRQILYQPYLIHTSRNSSELLSGVGRADEIVASIINPIFLLINSLFTISFLLLTLLLLNPVVIISTFTLVGSFYFFTMFFVKNRLKIESKYISISQHWRTKAMQEGLGGIRDILIDGTQDVYTYIFSKNDKDFRNSKAKIVMITNSPSIAIQSFGIVIIAIFASSIALKNNIFTSSFSTGIPFLGALAFSYLKISPAIQQIYSTWASLKNGEFSLNYVVNFLEPSLPDHAGKTLPAPIKFNIELKINDISFRYNSDTNFVFQNLNLVIKKGSKVGFVGKTGSGKSTLLDIIMALIDPTEGNFEIDGVKINKNNFRSWQVHIAHVPQAIYLSDSTIAENIAFGIPLEDIDYSRVKLAAEKAQLTETIEILDKKYNTIVGERGIRLSGGQRQRLGIARALYKKADVIVFDEATSALDIETETEVMKSINNLDHDLTILIVAHRLTTLKNCDQIIELKDSKIYIHENYEMFIAKSN
jgi:ABC-type multidrug transport system fused ATPase/permease subunit